MSSKLNNDKIGLKGYKWSSLNAFGTEYHLSHAAAMNKDGFPRPNSVYSLLHKRCR